MARVHFIAEPLSACSIARGVEKWSGELDCGQLGSPSQFHDWQRLAQYAEVSKVLEPRGLGAENRDVDVDGRVRVNLSWAYHFPAAVA